MTQPKVNLPVFQIDLRRLRSDVNKVVKLMENYEIDRRRDFKHIIGKTITYQTFLLRAFPRDFRNIVDTEAVRQGPDPAGNVYSRRGWKEYDIVEVSVGYNYKQISLRLLGNVEKDPKLWIRYTISCLENTIDPTTLNIISDIQNLSNNITLSQDLGPVAKCVEENKEGAGQRTLIQIFTDLPADSGARGPFGWTEFVNTYYYPPPRIVENVIPSSPAEIYDILNKLDTNPVKTPEDLQREDTQISDARLKYGLKRTAEGGYTPVNDSQSKLFDKDRINGLIGQELKDAVGDPLRVIKTAFERVITPTTFCCLIQEAVECLIPPLPCREMLLEFEVTTLLTLGKFFLIELGPFSENAETVWDRIIDAWNAGDKTRAFVEAENYLKELVQGPQGGNNDVNITELDGGEPSRDFTLASRNLERAIKNILLDILETFVDLDTLCQWHFETNKRLAMELCQAKLSGGKFGEGFGGINQFLPEYIPVVDLFGATRAEIKNSILEALASALVTLIEGILNDLDSCDTLDIFAAAALQRNLAPGQDLMDDYRRLFVNPSSLDDSERGSVISSFAERFDKFGNHVDRVLSDSVDFDFSLRGNLLGLGTADLDLGTSFGPQFFPGRDPLNDWNTIFKDGQNILQGKSLGGLENVITGSGFIAGLGDDTNLGLFLAGVAASGSVGQFEGSIGVGQIPQDTLLGVLARYNPLTAGAGGQARARESVSFGPSLAGSEMIRRFQAAFNNSAGTLNEYGLDPTGEGRQFTNPNGGEIAQYFLNLTQGECPIFPGDETAEQGAAAGEPSDPFPDGLPIFDEDGNIISETAVQGVAPGPSLEPYPNGLPILDENGNPVNFSTSQGKMSYKDCLGKVFDSVLAVLTPGESLRLLAGEPSIKVRDLIKGIVRSQCPELSAAGDPTGLFISMGQVMGLNRIKDQVILLSFSEEPCETPRPLCPEDDRRITLRRGILERVGYSPEQIEEEIDEIIKRRTKRYNDLNKFLLDESQTEQELAERIRCGLNADGTPDKIIDRQTDLAIDAMYRPIRMRFNAEIPNLVDAISLDKSATEIVPRTIDAGLGQQISFGDFDPNIGFVGNIFTQSESTSQGDLKDQKVNPAFTRMLSSGFVPGDGTKDDFPGPFTDGPPIQRQGLIKDPGGVFKDGMKLEYDQVVVGVPEVGNYGISLKGSLETGDTLGVGEDNVSSQISELLQKISQTQPSWDFSYTEQANGRYQLKIDFRGKMKSNFYGTVPFFENYRFSGKNDSLNEYLESGRGEGCTSRDVFVDFMKMKLSDVIADPDAIDSLTTMFEQQHDDYVKSITSNAFSSFTKNRLLQKIDSDTNLKISSGAAGVVEKEDQAGIILELFRLNPIQSELEAKCKVDPHLLDLEKVKRTVKKESDKCQDIFSTPVSDGFTATATPLSTAGLMGAVLTTVRLYVIEYTLRSLFVYDELGYPQSLTEDTLLIDYISSRMRDDIIRLGFWETFEKEMFITYNKLVENGDIQAEPEDPVDIAAKEQLESFVAQARLFNESIASNLVYRGLPNWGTIDRKKLEDLASLDLKAGSQAQEALASLGIPKQLKALTKLTMKSVFAKISKLLGKKSTPANTSERLFINSLPMLDSYSSFEGLFFEAAQEEAETEEEVIQRNVSRRNVDNTDTGGLTATLFPGQNSRDPSSDGDVARPQAIGAIDQFGSTGDRQSQAELYQDFIEENLGVKPYSSINRRLEKLKNSNKGKLVLERYIRVNRKNRNEETPLNKEIDIADGNLEDVISLENWEEFLGRAEELGINMGESSITDNFQTWKYGLRLVYILPEWSQRTTGSSSLRNKNKFKDFSSSSSSSLFEQGTRTEDSQGFSDLKIEQIKRQKSLYHEEKFGSGYKQFNSISIACVEAPIGNDIFETLSGAKGRIVSTFENKYKEALLQQLSKDEEYKQFLKNVLSTDRLQALIAIYSTIVVNTESMKMLLEGSKIEARRLFNMLSNLGDYTSEGENSPENMERATEEERQNIGRPGGPAGLEQYLAWVMTPVHTIMNLIPFFSPTGQFTKMMVGLASDGLLAPAFEKVVGDVRIVEDDDSFTGQTITFDQEFIATAPAFKVLNGEVVVLDSYVVETTDQTTETDFFGNTTELEVTKRFLKQGYDPIQEGGGPIIKYTRVYKTSDGTVAGIEVDEETGEPVILTGVDTSTNLPYTGIPVPDTNSLLSGVGTAILGASNILQDPTEALNTGQQAVDAGTGALINVSSAVTQTAGGNLLGGVLAGSESIVKLQQMKQIAETTPDFFSTSPSVPVYPGDPIILPYTPTAYATPFSTPQDLFAKFAWAPYSDLMRGKLPYFQSIYARSNAAAEIKKKYGIDLSQNLPCSDDEEETE